MGNPGGKRPLGRSRCTWMDSIKMGFGDTGWGDVGWIGLVQGRDQQRAPVNVLMNLRVP
jgi:hypothetical protein